MLRKVTRIQLNIRETKTAPIYFLEQAGPPQQNVNTNGTKRIEITRVCVHIIHDLNKLKIMCKKN